MNLLFVCGARPNFMKISPLVRACRKHKINFKIVHTGQHYDVEMSHQFFDDLKIPKPEYNLKVGSKSHAKQTGYIIDKFEGVCIKEKPDIVVVVGDVNSTLACSLVVSKMKEIKLAHVEAGARSFDRDMPEEINRVVTDVLSDYLFCLNHKDSKHLCKVRDVVGEIHVVGDIMIDNLLYFLPLTGNTMMKGKPFALVTIHRASNTDDKDRLRTILESLQSLSSYVPVIFPIHPRTKKMINKFRLNSCLNTITCLPPLGYFDFLKYLKDCSLVITDSGGLQVETTVLNKKCLTVRKNTERPFTLIEGTNKLIEPDEIINNSVEHFMSSKGICSNLNIISKELLDGNTAERIIKVLLK